MNFETDLLALSKRIGLSFLELNELTVESLFAIAQSYMGTEEESDEPRQADQSDIDAFFGR